MSKLFEDSDSDSVDPSTPVSTKDDLSTPVTPVSKKTRVSTPVSKKPRSVSKKSDASKKPPVSKKSDAKKKPPVSKKSDAKKKSDANKKPPVSKKSDAKKKSDANKKPPVSKKSDANTNPTCFECEKKLSKDTCFPPGSWGSSHHFIFRCQKHWEEHAKLAREAEKNTERKRKEYRDKLVEQKKNVQEKSKPPASSAVSKEKEKPPASSAVSKEKAKPPASSAVSKEKNKLKPPASVSKEKNKPPVSTFELHQVVDAKFKSNSKSYFRAYIVNDDKKPNFYDVYYPEDSTPRRNTPVGDIREIKARSPYGFWEKHLSSFQGLQFTMINKGKFKIIGMKLETFEFKCSPVSSRRKSVQYFDLGVVLRTIKQDMEKQRGA